MAERLTNRFYDKKYIESSGAEGGSLGGGGSASSHQTGITLTTTNDIPYISRGDSYGRSHGTTSRKKNEIVDSRGRIIRF